MPVKCGGRAQPQRKKTAPRRSSGRGLAVADDDERRALDALGEHLEVVELEELA